MIEESGREYLSADEAARRLRVSVRRIYDLIRENRLRAHSLAGRHLIEADSVEARRLAGSAVGRPLSPRRAWALILLAEQRDPSGLDAVTKSKLRRLLKERDLWQMRARLAKRAERREFRAHPSDLKRIEEEPRLVRTSARFAAKAGLRLHAPEAPLEFYVEPRRARDLVARYRLRPSRDPNVILHVVPPEVRAWLQEPVAPRVAVALDLADHPDARSQDVARQVLSGT